MQHQRGNRNSNSRHPHRCLCWVDVIIPVHNAASTIEEAMYSAIRQEILEGGEWATTTATRITLDLNIAVCCWDDGSTDDSWERMVRIQQEHCSSRKDRREENSSTGRSGGSGINPAVQVLLGRDAVSQGAGYARNRAAELRKQQQQTDNIDSDTYDEYFLCWLDSDDVMYPTRVYHQVQYLMSNLPDQSSRDRTLLGCTFARDPPDSTWHYTTWANQYLTTNERLHFEQFRECTVIQPTWMMTRHRFWNDLGGYIEAQSLLLQSTEIATAAANKLNTKSLTSTSLFDAKGRLRLVHPTFDTPQTLRLAEDMRLFFAHLYHGGLLRLLRSCDYCDADDADKEQRQAPALVTYRHRVGQSQSSQTPRSLLVHLKALSFEIMVLSRSHYRPSTTATSTDDVPDQSDLTVHGNNWNRFVVWGAGRDGKDFVKALPSHLRERIVCMVDVDLRKIQQVKYYSHAKMKIKIPIVHYSWLCKDTATCRKEQERALAEWRSIERKEPKRSGRIDKSRPSSQSIPWKEENRSSSTPPKKRIRSDSGSNSTISNPISDTRNEPNKTESKANETAPDKSLFCAIPKFDTHALRNLPVIVCVAMYRTNGALERNVANIGRTEGFDLWHFN